MALAGAAPPQAIPRFTSGVDVVQFTVTVLDKERRPIAGLTAADFAVMVDGTPRPLAAFAAVTLPDDPSGAVDSIPPVAPDVQTNQLSPEGRVVVVVLDRSTPSGQPMQTARDVANAAIDRLGPADLGAVVFTAKGLRRYSQGLTRDRVRLHAAVAEALIGAGEEPGEKIPIAAGMDAGTVQSGDAAGGAGAGRGGPPAARAEKQASRVQMASEEDSGECYCGLCVPEQLTAMAKALSSAPARYKAVLFIGSDIAIASRDPTGHCAALIQPARDRLSRALDAANVTVHVIDTRGLEPLAASAELASPVGVADQRANQFRQLSLAVLPDHTGGRLVVNTNRPADAIGPIFDESRSYYVLAVTRDSAPAGGDDRRPITISVKRRDAIVRARDTYFVSGADRTPPANAAAAVLAGLLPRGDFELHLNLVPWFGADGVPEIRVLLGAPSRIAGRLDAMIGAFNSLSEPVGDLLRQRLEIPAAAAAAGDRFQWTSVLRPPPGSYDVRAGVATADGTRAASVYGSVDVPDLAKAQLALSGLVVKRAGTPTLDRDFAAGDAVGLSFQVARAKGTASTATVRYSLRDEAGREHGNAEVPHARALRVSETIDGYDIGIRAPTTPGRYVATIEANDGGRRVTRQLVFAVR